MGNQNTDYIELEARRVISEEYREFREHLESQLTQVKWIAGILVTGFVALVMFFGVKSWKDLDEILQGKVNEIVLEKGLKEKVIDSATKIAESAEVKDKLAQRISEIVSGQTLAPIEEVVVQKKAEIEALSAESFTSEAPVGTIIASIIPPDRMLVIGKEKWVLSDGRILSEDSEYKQVTGNSQIPDLRGVFLRGLNVGRKDAFSDPSGDRRPGSAQSDELGSHNHKIGINGTDTFSMAPGGATQRLAHFNSDGYGAGPAKTTEYSGTAETRPKNIGVFFYIRVKA